MTPPNIALFASSFAPHLGGVEELSRRLAIELRRRGSDTAVLTNRYPSDLPATETIDGVPVYRERFRFPEPRPRHMAGFVVGTLSTRGGVAKAMTDHRAQLVHVQCVSSNAYYALRAARAARLPLVVTLQGELSMDAGQAFQRSAALRRTWRQLLTYADVVTGCSQQVIDEAVAEYGPGLATKARVIRNGADVDHVHATDPEHRPRRYIFGIGRFVPQKGIDVLIDAFAEIADRCPDVDLLLAGDGVDRDALHHRAAPLGQRVEFLGGVPVERAFALYRGAAAFVLPSRHEPQGIVVIEAMAAGTPVIATRVGGVPETVRDGENGLLVPAEDSSAMADAIAQVLSDPTTAYLRATQASVDVLDYDWPRITDQYEAAYRDAIEAHRD